MAKEKITGQRIRSARRAIDLTQGELADKCQINRVTVSSWERGLYKPEGDVLKKLALILGVPEGYILGQTETDVAETRGAQDDLNFYKVPILRRLIVDHCKNKTVLAELTNNEAGGFLYWPRDKFVAIKRFYPPFAIRALGDCMDFCGIHDGDLVIINPSEEPEQGSAVLVWLMGISSLVYYYKCANGDVVLSRGEGRQRRIPRDKVREEGFEVIGSVVGSCSPRPLIRPLFFDEQ